MKKTKNTRFKKGHVPWHKGRKGVYTPEQLKRFSEARKGIPAWNKGISPTKEQIEKQRVSIKKITSNPKYRKQMSEKFKKAWSNPELRKKQSESIKKYFSNPEVRKKLSESLKGKIVWNKGKKTGKPSWNKGISPSKEAKEKQSEIMKRILSNPEARKRISEATKKAMSNPEIIKKLKENRANQIFPLKDTKIEIKIQNFLKQLNIEFLTHKYMHIEHSYQCDILIPSLNLVIECDGDTYHFNPKKYNKDSRIFKTGMTAEQKWKLDAIRTKELLEKGFKVLRLWESDINKMNFKEFIEKIKLFEEDLK